MAILASSCSGPGKSALGTGVYYEVKQGDTLGRIAKIHHTTPGKLAEINKINQPDQLQEGIILFIPYSDQALAKAPAAEPDAAADGKPKVRAPLPPVPEKKAADIAGETDADGVVKGSGSADDEKKAPVKKAPPVRVKKTPVSQPLWTPPASQKSSQAQTSDRATLKETTVAPKSPAATTPPAPRREEIASVEKGRFSWPVKGKVSDRFGRQPNGMYFNHVRIVTKDGAPVVTSAPGMVIFSAPLKEFGETVIVKHDQRFATVYTHLGSRMVKVDHRVKKGEQIGLAGKSEGKNEGYIHFEIRDHNKSRNPLLFLP